MAIQDNPAYQRFVRKGARMMSRILQNTSEKTTVPIHALAEHGPISGDLLVKIAEIAEQNPDKDIVVFIQRFKPEDLKV